MKKSLSTTHIILICGFLLLFVFMAVGGYLFLNRQTETDLGSKTPLMYGNTYVLSEGDDIDEIEAKAAQEVEDGMFLTTMNVIWNFTSSKEASYDAFVANDSSNTRPVYIEAVLEDTEEVVFRSTVIPPGSALAELTLEKRLKKGSYPAVCNYYLIDEETEEVASTLSVAVTIVIEN